MSLAARWAAAFAPASVRNMGIGSDILDFSVPALVDRALRSAVPRRKGVTITDVRGVGKLPTDPQHAGEVFAWLRAAFSHATGPLIYWSATAALPAQRFCAGLRVAYHRAP